MAAWSKFVNMELTDEEKIDAILPIPMESGPEYPYGLRICLTQAELDKCNLEDDCEVGDMLDLRALARVTSVSMNDGPSGRQCRIELQIEQMAVENENDEDEGE